MKGSRSGWLLGLISRPYFSIILLIFINLIIGAAVFQDYGESWDERLRYTYAERSLSAYSGTERVLTDEKGAFYVMLAKLGSDLIRRLEPGLKPIEAWHFIHFLSFLLAVFFFYRICRKYTGVWAAFGATLVFNSQPLLWGHAFINPKDIPFMAFFLGSVLLGMDMVEGYTRSDPGMVASGRSEEQPAQANALTGQREKFNRKRIIAFALISALVLAILFCLILFNSQIQARVYLFVERAYLAPDASWIGQLFDRLATQRVDIPMELYAQKAQILYARSLPVLVILILVAWLGSLVWFLRPVHAILWRGWLRPWIELLGKAFINPKVILAGVFLGFSMSIRTLGLASGLLVGVYFLIKFRWRSLPVLTAYALIGCLVAYLTWPNLWGSPVQSFFYSLTLASSYPWDGKVLYAGIDYPVNSVPWHYLPVLLILQTPELTLVIFLIGLVSAAAASLKNKLEPAKALVVFLWFFAPLVLAVLLKPVMYDNFRQFLFILPGAFILIGIGLQAIFDLLKHKAWAVLVIGVLVIPNLYSLISLHPYQYIYYNRLVGGMNGAFRSYEMDYWATSYKEVSEWLNENLPQAATVIVWGPSHIVEHYIRPDLVVMDYSSKKAAELPTTGYAVIASRHNKDLSLYPEASVLFNLERNGIVLAVVKELLPAPVVAP